MANHEPSEQRTIAGIRARSGVGKSAMQKTDENRLGLEEMLRHRELGAENFAPIEGDYSFAPPKPEPGKHYFSAPCEHCGKLAPLLTDTMDGRGANPLRGRGRLITDCAHCGGEVKANPETTVSARWAGT